MDKTVKLILFSWLLTVLWRLRNNSSFLSRQPLTTATTPIIVQQQPRVTSSPPPPRSILMDNPIHRRFPNLERNTDILLQPLWFDVIREFTPKRFLRNPSPVEEFVLNTFGLYDEAAAKKSSLSFFIEIGGGEFDGGESVTWTMQSELKWRGVIIEPCPRAVEGLRRHRATSSVSIVHSPLCPPAKIKNDSSALAVTYLQPAGRIGCGPVEELTNFATLMKHKTSPRYKLDCVYWPDIMKPHAPGAVIDVLVIDTMGGEVPLLTSFDFTTYSVKIIVISFTTELDQQQGHAFLVKTLRMKFVQNVANSLVYCNTSIVTFHPLSPHK
eukprot:PhF_6_TR28341/c0_g1_i1/m.42021